MSSESVVVRMGWIHWFVHRYLARRLEADGLTSRQFRFLSYLLRHDRVHQEQIAADLMVDRAVATRTIRDLIEAGYVVRERDPADRRAYRVTLTERGRATAPLIDEVVRNLNDALLAGLSNEEQATLISILDRMVENVQRSELPASCRCGRDA
ncbi:MarR family transcriptional regulator [Methanoculleus sp.]|uniref:MarR family winged helix-turn-helix transcriptional regulator n=1 Tax=Methanoculleus sp. TaxID=90427 RepID=UPI001BD35FFF